MTEVSNEESATRILLKNETRSLIFMKLSGDFLRIASKLDTIQSIRPTTTDIL